MTKWFSQNTFILAGLLYLYPTGGCTIWQDQTCKCVFCCNQDYKREKTFGVASLHASQVALLVIQTILSLSFTLQLGGSLLFTSSLIIREIHPSAMTHSFREVAPGSLDTKAITFCGTWVFFLSCFQTKPFKKWRFSLEVRSQSFEVDSPCLPLCPMNNEPYFLFLKSLLSLFVNCYRGQGDWLSSNTMRLILWAVRWSLWSEDFQILCVPPEEPKAGQVGVHGVY
jgi:hypothetical protein